MALVLFTLGSRLAVFLCKCELDASVFVFDFFSVFLIGIVVLHVVFMVAVLTSKCEVCGVMHLPLLRAVAAHI